MSKSAPQISVLTANRLGDGIVVFLDFEGAWSEDIAWRWSRAHPDEARRCEDRGAYDAARNLVVEPYLVEVREAGGQPHAPSATASACASPAPASSTTCRATVPRSLSRLHAGEGRVRADTRRHLQLTLARSP